MDLEIYKVTKKYIFFKRYKKRYLGEVLPNKKWRRRKFSLGQEDCGGGGGFSESILIINVVSWISKDF